MADTRITIRIPVRTADRLIDLAEKHGTNMTEIMRQALAAYMADQDEADRLTQMEARLADKICRHVTKEINSLVIEVEQKFEQA